MATNIDKSVYQAPMGLDQDPQNPETDALSIEIENPESVTLDDGSEKKTFHLNRSYFGLYIPPMMWRDLDNFSSGAVCMVLASEHYDELDYFREYVDFLQATKDRP